MCTRLQCFMCIYIPGSGSLQQHMGTTVHVVISTRVQNYICTSVQKDTFTHVQMDTCTHVQSYTCTPVEPKVRHMCNMWTNSRCLTLVGADILLVGWFDVF